MAKKDASADLTELPGVGPSTAAKLTAAGLDSAERILEAGKDGLVAAGISAATAANILAGVAKETGAKVASAAKAASSKAAKTATKAATKAAAKGTVKAAKAAAKGSVSSAKDAVKSATSKVQTAGRTERLSTSSKEDNRKGKTLKSPSLADILKRRSSE
jgi:hypothetical protein